METDLDLLTFGELFELYKQVFGEPVPTLYLDDWEEDVREALRKGEPIPEPDLPDGAFI